MPLNFVYYYEAYALCWFEILRYCIGLVVEGLSGVCLVLGVGVFYEYFVALGLWFELR